MSEKKAGNGVRKMHEFAIKQWGVWGSCEPSVGGGSFEPIELVPAGGCFEQFPDTLEPRRRIWGRSRSVQEERCVALGFFTTSAVLPLCLVKLNASPESWKC